MVCLNAEGIVTTEDDIKLYPVFHGFCMFPAGACGESFVSGNVSHGTFRGKCELKRFRTHLQVRFLAGANCCNLLTRLTHSVKDWIEKLLRHPKLRDFHHIL